MILNNTLKCQTNSVLDLLLSVRTACGILSSVASPHTHSQCVICTWRSHISF